MRNTMNVGAIGLVAVAVALSGGFAVAGDIGELDQNDNGPRGGGGRFRTLVKPPEKVDGDTIELDQNDDGPRGGGGRFRTLVKPRDDSEEESRQLCLTLPLGFPRICVL